MDDTGTLHQRTAEIKAIEDIVKGVFPNSTTIFRRIRLAETKQVITGEIQRVSQDGFTIKVNDQWYRFNKALRKKEEHNIVAGREITFTTSSSTRDDKITWWVNEPVTFDTDLPEQQILSNTKKSPSPTGLETKPSSNVGGDPLVWVKKDLRISAGLIFKTLYEFGDAKFKKMTTEEQLELVAEKAAMLYLSAESAAQTVIKSLAEFDAKSSVKADDLEPEGIDLDEESEIPF